MDINVKDKRDVMKNLLKILIVLTFFAIIFYYTVGTDDKTEPLVSSTGSSQPIPKTEIVENTSQYMARPETGISTFIGKESKEVMNQFGLPSRIEPSGYGYDWWIYLNENQLQMYGVDDEIVRQVYTNSTLVDATPYMMNQTLDDIYRMTLMESEIMVQVEDNYYIFMMNEQDMKTRLLIPFDGVFAQLYIDKESKQLTGIRYMDQTILLMHQPYEYQYVGEKLQGTATTSYEQLEVDHAYANQLFDLVNDLRIKNNVKKLLKSSILSEVALIRSENLYIEQVMPTEEEEDQSLVKLLDEYQILFKNEEENLAMNYGDAIEAYHGWLNSEQHKKNMLSSRYNVTGTGVYMGYFAQVFIEKEPEKNEKY